MHHHGNPVAAAAALPTALRFSFAYCVRAVITPACIILYTFTLLYGHLARTDRAVRLLMSQTRDRQSPLVLPDTWLGDTKGQTPHTFLGAVNNDKNCLLSHFNQSSGCSLNRALARALFISLPLAHSLAELCVRSMSLRSFCPLLHTASLRPAINLTHALFTPFLSPFLIAHFGSCMYRLCT